jgi:ribosome maturation factor RimP
MSRQSDREALLSRLAPVVAEHGLDLEDVTVTPAGKRRLLRVIVDGDEGVSLDAVAAVSTDVSKSLDDSDEMGGQPYVLEVTSPGVDRPLTQPRHWRRARNRLVKVTLADGSTVEGRVTAAGDDAATLDVDGTGREVAYSDITTARVQVEFNRKDGA